MNRIDKCFEELRSKGKKALIPYICSGDPTVEATEQLVYMLEDAGADIVELGIPYSDPLADGPVIQEAGIRAYSNGYCVTNTFDIIKRIRKNSQMPIAIMVYYSTILGYGKEKFLKNCVESDADGLIIPDLPYEEYDDFKPLIDKTDLAMIPLVAITSEDRIPMLTKNTKGFIYCVSSLGVTGERKSFDTRLEGFLKKVKESTDTPICIGFGISKHEDVVRFSKITDGCIVGSALVRKIFDSGMNEDEIKKFVRELKGDL